MPRPRLRPEELLLAMYASLLVVLMVVYRTFPASAFLHPRFLQVTGGLALVVFARGLLRARRTLPLAPAASRGWASRFARKEGPAAARAGREALAVLRDFLPFFAVILLYEALHDLTPVVRPDVVDARLVAIDRAVFGVDVSSWMGGFASPSLTRVMVACYASYFISLPLLAAAIYFRGERRLFRDLMVSGVLTTVLGYVGYLLVPAVGPYVYQAELFPTRLPGGGPETHLFIAAIDDLRGVARDCFPSLHTAHTTVVLVYALRFRRWLFLAFLPVAIGLYVSTMYLRMHYAVDVAAGFATAAAAIWLGPRVDRLWDRAFTRTPAVVASAAVPAREARGGGRLVELCSTRGDGKVPP